MLEITIDIVLVQKNTR